MGFWELIWHTLACILARVQQVARALPVNWPNLSIYFLPYLFSSRDDKGKTSDDPQGRMKVYTHINHCFLTIVLFKIF